MTGSQLAYYWTKIPQVEAQRLLREASYRPDLNLSADQLYDLTLAATQSQRKAEEAFKARRHQELRAGRTPA